MPNIIFFSENQQFSEDIKEQISLYAPEYNFYTEYESEEIYDLVILDDGEEIIKKIREYGFKVPIIYFLSKENETIPFTNSDIVMKKPVKLDEFLDFLKSSIYLFDKSEDGYVKFNSYELRPMSKEILNERNGEVIKLTEKEVAILKYLHKSNKIVSKTDLLQNVWGYSPESSTHTIETHIYRLRNKVEESNNPETQIIITEDGGYKLKV
ncbi:MAG: response regulator transcription factor [Alphaproteobacteria bacterium]|nr:response regulator transcription factor [Alphaproteobacteria bacterium]